MPKKVWLVEDSQTDAAVITEYLKEAELDVRIFDSGEAAVLAMDTEKPDLMVVDTILPGIDGFEVCRRAKEKFGGGSPKVIIMTGHIDAVDAVTARRSGADDYAVKTSSCSSILQAVKALLQP